nr:MAG TPA: hypothetical protein [Caudoviricetes sp.]
MVFFSERYHRQAHFMLSHFLPKLVLADAKIITPMVR